MKSLILNSKILRSILIKRSYCTSRVNKNIKIRKLQAEINDLKRSIDKLNNDNLLLMHSKLSNRQSSFVFELDWLPILVLLLMLYYFFIR